MSIYFSTSLGDYLSNKFQAPFSGSTNTTLSVYQQGGSGLQFVTYSIGTKLGDSGYQQAGVDISTILQPIAGDRLYTTAGTYTWVCPANVTSVCILAIGAGGGAAFRGTVTNAGTAGGLSNFTNGATVIVRGGGGTQGTTSGAGSGGTAAGTTGFVGFSGGAGGYNATGGTNGGGGGAAGYAGVGGRGGSTVVPTAGTGGGGGGGGGHFQGNFSGSGGGTGVYGQGANGAAGTNNSAAASAAAGGKAGSGGTNGNTGLGNISGGTYGGGTMTYNGALSTAFGGGGGGGLAYINNYAVTPGNSYGVIVGARGNTFNPAGTPVANAGGGAVRIIWGPGRAFPSTNVGLYNQTLN